ncbi:MAG TPA: mechanosensitive ion channel domain-containing protein [Acidimicrobiales bacterium]|jgi:small-conductance mechanosensitive channel|nr:mechanosensitive ion channel domain-containing protein [Acidimicrobiales bacterium]
MAKGNPFEMKHTLKTEWILGVIGGAVTLAALGLGRAFGKISRSSINEKLIVWAAAVVLVVAGAFAIVHLSRAAGRSVARKTSIGTGASVRLITNGVGYLILIFALLTVLGVSLDHLLIGAGVAGIILGVAAQQSLGNVFAAVVMLVARPFVVGDMIRIRSGVTGVLDVRVLGIGLTYVTVETDDGLLRVPNSLLLAAGIGQLRPGATLIPSQKPMPPPDAEPSAPAQVTPPTGVPTASPSTSPVDPAPPSETP